MFFFGLYINNLNPDFQNFDFFLPSYNPFKWFENAKNQKKQLKIFSSFWLCKIKLDFFYKGIRFLKIIAINWNFENLSDI